MKVLKNVKSILGVCFILVMVKALSTACSDHSGENSADKNQRGYAKDLKSDGIAIPI